MSTESRVRAVTTFRLSEMKQRGEKIAMLTSYDYSMARIVDAAGVDVILVGDSAANVMAGYETTLPITLDMMIYHARSVVRAVERALVVVDLPFGTYQGNSKVALESAVRIMKETEADAVKMEGGEEILESVQRILSAGIPVMGHLGLTPQSIHKFGTYAVRAKEEAEKKAAAPAEESSVDFTHEAEISYDDFCKVELRVAEVRACENLKESKKLLHLTVFDGERERCILSGIAKWFKPEDLIGKKLGIVCNLAPRPMMKGKYVSEGMIFAADTADGGCSIPFYSDDTPVGARIH